MALADLNPEQLKSLMRRHNMIRANIENWKYVEANKHLVPREQLEQTITQMLNQFDPMMQTAQLATEIEALSKLDPIDLL